MTAFIVRRLIWGFALVVILSFSTYAIFAAIPYDPGHIVVGQRATTAQLAQADHRLGIDQPFYVQYMNFLRGLSHGSLGTTFLGLSVDHLIAAAAPITIALVLGGSLLMLLIAIPLALLSANRAQTWVDRLVLAVSVVGIAFHPFIVGVALRGMFATTLHVLPGEGYCPMHAIHIGHGPPARLVPPSSGQIALQGARVNCTDAPWPWLWFSHLLLPWFTFALFFLPFYTRMIRSSLLETYSEPYVTAARAKGVSERRLLTHHLLRAVLGTTVAMLAIDIGTAVTASIYVETVFGLPGLGHQALIALGANSTVERGYDLPTMVGIVFVVALAVVVLNVLADIALAWLDPRVRSSPTV